MSSTVGKITGQMLESNLLRDGVDLAFDTDLIYLDVNNNRIGINNDVPYRTLIINNTVRSTDSITNTQATIANFKIQNNTILNLFDNIYLSSNQPGGRIQTGQIQVDGIKIDNNIISTTRSNENLDLTLSGSGEFKFFSNTEVFADVHVTGDVTFDGTITIGNSNTDSVVFDTEISSDIVPNNTNTYKLGLDSKLWSSLHTNLVNGASLTSTGGTLVAGIDMNLRQGNTWFVSVNGGSGNYGDHIQDPFDKIEDALAVATAGDTIYIFPGTYYELLPLTVPVGVTVKGFGVRSVTIKPDTASAGENVFLLNGETTVEDLTIADFYYDSINDTGYAFSFAPGFTVSSRSPYVRNVSVITKGSVVSGSDPRGFDTGDAGRGAKIDGSLANPASKEASLLFHSVTFITPGQRSIWMTNGVRVEWLNCFIYFAAEGLYANAGAVGFAGNGKTRLKIYGISAQTINPGDTVSVENVSQNNTFTTATIESVTYDGPYTNIIIDGYVTGWETSSSPPDTSNQQQINFSGGQTASHLEWADYSDFGAEVRAIGSANVYGTVGAKADGAGTLIYLISHNFGYIGSGKLSNNDISDVIDTNETIEINNGKIYYQSMDQQGNFRVGDIFKVESATGRIAFQSNLFTSTNLILTDDTNTTYVDAFEISTGNITISGNTIQSNSGGITLHAANSDIDILSNVTANNNVITNNFVTNKNTTVGTTDANSIDFRSNISSNFIPNDNTFSLGLNSKKWKTLYTGNTTFDDILIDTNFITTTLSNSNLQLDANGLIYFDDITITDNTLSSINNYNLIFNPNGTGRIKLEKDTDVQGNLDITNNVTVDGDVILGDVILDTINTVAKINSNLIPDFSGVHDVGSLTKTWKNLYFSQILINDLVIDDNYIKTVLSNADLELNANGIGQVIIKDSLVANQNFTVSFTTTFNNADVNTILDVNGYTTVTNQLTAVDFTTGDILINDNYITTTSSNSNLEIFANNSGGVIIDDFLKITNSTIENIRITGTEVEKSIIFNPDSNQILKINSNLALQLPVGSDLNRTLYNTGEIRFNPTNFLFEGFVVTGAKSLYALYDADKNTGITAELTPGANDNIIRMFSNGNVIGSISYESSTFTSVIVDEIKFDGNQISTINSNADLELNPSGTGVVRFKDDFTFTNNILTNLNSNVATTLQATGSGYFSFVGTNALIIPAGTNLQRLASPDIGATRFNTDQSYGEVWDGSLWIPVNGNPTNLISDQEMDEMSTLYALIFG